MTQLQRIPGAEASHEHPRYKWVVLSNTTLGTLLATINASIVLISLPAIFRGIGLNPLHPANVGYLLWMLMGYLVVTAAIVNTMNPRLYIRTRPYMSPRRPKGTTRTAVTTR